MTRNLLLLLAAACTNPQPASVSPPSTQPQDTGEPPTPVPTPTPPTEPEGTCGNGIVEPGEDCEPGEPFYSCASDCTTVCGDGDVTTDPCLREDATRATGNVLAVIDFDGDGLSDVITLEGSDLTLHAGSASGLQAPVAVLDVGGVDSVQGHGDIDQDGAIDLVLGTQTAGTSIVFGGNVVPPRQVQVSTTYGTTLVGDYDADGAVDLVLFHDGGGFGTGSGTGSAFAWHRQTAPDTFQVADELFGTQAAAMIDPVAADWDQDGADEVLGYLANDSSGGLQGTLVKVTDQALTMSSVGVQTTGSTVPTSGDLTGDGCPDVVVVWGDHLRLNACGALSAPLPRPQLAIPDAETVMGVADFDGDGLADLLVRSNSGTVDLWRSLPSGTHQQVPLPTAFGGLSFAGFADVDGDGAAELIAHGLTGQLQVFSWDP